ncbi:MAG: NAD(P)-dependent dehydrogenase (short-subunit alcohol dehydrogenase family) [Enterobacterales bacterium]|jgi:NAD(P)-dependent dehydrogenase (short-subunit alcohol dehydrogenase family)
MKQLTNVFIITIVLLVLINTKHVQADSTETVLITGANRGIGLALVKKFKKEGYSIIASARKPSKSIELNSLGVRVEQLDVTDPESVKKMAERLKGIKIDVLINNAGILGNDSPKFKDLDIERIALTLNVNSLGPIRVTQALLPQLSLSNKKLVANIGSDMGSITNNSSGGLMGYRASKTALNSFVKSLSIRLARQGFTFVALHPGWVVTDMSNGSGNFTSTESANNLFNVITQLTTKDNGKFYNYNGEPLPW